MNRLRSPRLLVLCVALLVLALTLPNAAFGAVDCKGEVYGADSPESLVAGVRKAAESGDMGQLAQYLSAADRAKAGLGLTVGATMMLAMQEMGVQMGEAGDDAGGDMEAKRAELVGLQTRLQAILDKYGVVEPSEEVMGQMMQQGPDAMASMEDTMKDVCTVGLIGELANLLSEVSERQVTEQLERLKSDDVGAIETNGDTASATIGGQPFEMRRVDGRWYVDIESTGR